MSGTEALLAASLAAAAASIATTTAGMVKSAEAAEDAAEAARLQGIEDEKLQRRKDAQLQAKRRVSQAKSGIDESGTALDVLGSAAEDAELNALRVRFGFAAESEAIGRQQQQRELQGIAALSNTILGTASNVAQLHRPANPNQNITIGNETASPNQGGGTWPYVRTA